jgi:hypothetical protein
MRPTDTGLAFNGEGEWQIAALARLGIPDDQAEGVVTLATGCDRGMVPVGRFTNVVRLWSYCQDLWIKIV